MRRAVLKLDRWLSTPWWAWTTCVVSVLIAFGSDDWVGWAFAALLSVNLAFERHGWVRVNTQARPRRRRAS